MLLLRNPIHAYAWGTIDGIAPIVGSAPTGDHEAELWVGTHPRGSSVVAAGPLSGQSLADVVAQDPRRWLGRDLADAGHRALPFLLKVLAIGQPLSLQAHPSAEQAERGFAREEQAGIPIDAPERSYRDASAKPEALVALTDTWALCGFRPPIEAANLLAGLRIEAFLPLIDALAGGGPDAVAAVTGWLLRLDGSSRTSMAAAVAASVDRVTGEDLEDPRVWVRRLVHAFPGDPSVVAPLLLNVLHLGAGEAVHLPAGNLHAYLGGTGIEVMSASDNVLRGGLTPKHIDVEELLAVVDFRSALPPRPVTAKPEPAITTYTVGDDAFALAVVDPAGAEVCVTARAPSLFLATGGPVTVAWGDDTTVIRGGQAGFVAPGSGPHVISGPGRLWWATTGAGLPRS